MHPWTPPLTLTYIISSCIHRNIPFCTSVSIFLTIVTNANCAVLYIQCDLVHLRIHCTFQQRRVEDSTEGESGGPRLDGQQGGDRHEYQLPTVSYGDCAEAEEGWLPSPSSARKVSSCTTGGWVQWITVISCVATTAAAQRVGNFISISTTSFST